MTKLRLVGGLAVAVLLAACGSVVTGPAAGRGSIAALSSITASSAVPGSPPASGPAPESVPPASVPPASIAATGSPFPAGSELGVPQAELESDAYVLYAQNGVVVVAVAGGCCGSQEGKPSTLWMSTDMKHWRDVTPPGSRKLVNPEYFPGMYAGFDQASFLNPTTGWVTTWNGGNFAVTAYRTSDSGKSWSAVLIGAHSDHGDDADWIQLLSPKVVFSQAVTPTGPLMTLSLTTDGGQSWRTVWDTHSPNDESVPAPIDAHIVFVSASRGFAAPGIPPTEPFEASGELFATSDGGVTWSQFTPPSLKTAGCPTVVFQPIRVRCLVSLPRFVDSTHGVLATEVIDGANASVGFDVTRDAGASWQLATSVDVSLPVFPTGGYPMTNYAFVSMPSMATWWIGSYTPQGVTARVTSDGGSQWSTVTATGFDGTPTALDAVDATHALLTTFVIGAAGTTNQVYATADAGRSWQRLFAH